MSFLKADCRVNPVDVGEGRFIQVEMRLLNLLDFPLMGKGRSRRMERDLLAERNLGG